MTRQLPRPPRLHHLRTAAGRVPSGIPTTITSIVAVLVVGPPLLVGSGAFAGVRPHPVATTADDRVAELIVPAPHQTQPVVAPGPRHHGDAAVTSGGTRAMSDAGGSTRNHLAAAAPDVADDPGSGDHGGGGEPSASDREDRDTDRGEHDSSDRDDDGERVEDGGEDRHEDRPEDRHADHHDGGEDGDGEGDEDRGSG